jgi:hypothetical protein
MKKPNRTFADFVGTLEYIEVCRIVVSPEGTFSVPSEKDGKIANVSPTTRKQLARFVTEFAKRLQLSGTSKRKKNQG